jgi:6-phosphogluconolactonase
MSELRLWGEVKVRREPADVHEALADQLLAAALRAVEQRGVFHLALSGGSTPEPFYHLLVTDPSYRAIPWTSTHVWIVDERQVPEDDARSNLRMIRESLLDHVPMRKRQRHPMPVLSAGAADEYEAQLREVIGSPTPVLDFVLLGMGDDCHTASLFPNSPAVDVTDRLVVANEGPAVTPPPRLTMTFPLLNAAREVAVLVIGGKKLPALQRVDAARTRRDPRTLPITGIQPAGSMTWHLDSAAAGLSIELE